MHGNSLTQEIFDKRMEACPLKDLEGNQYGFDKAVYKGSATKLTVTCKIHGEFEIRPYDLKKGKGCGKCGRIRSGKKQSAEAKKVFKTKSSKIHGNKYDYSCSKYISSSVKVEIICPKHGSFWQQASEHLRGYGCNDCALEARAKARTGSGNPRWVDDRSQLVDGKRIGGMTTWSNSIKRGRDHCDCCNTKFTEDNRAIAHHLNSYKDFPEQRLDVENGVALCFACHMAFHKEYGFGGNTAEQYYEYKFK